MNYLKQLWNQLWNRIYTWFTGITDRFGSFLSGFRLSKFQLVILWVVYFLFLASFAVETLAAIFAFAVTLVVAVITIRSLK